ncbi:lipid A-modifier LpxR family protein [Frigidibacter sp. MR17.14]|uniref:lipid A-modifier LpxR family protein n=1 Tax=Frigidibacter sp. MR17.14 TaxID=3126509 RepID=UPI003012C663
MKRWRLDAIGPVRRAAALGLILCALALPATAGPQSVAPRTEAPGDGWLGFGRLLSDDVLAGPHDRWRTGAYQLSAVFGPRWDGRLPASPGTVIELRLRAEALAPARLAFPAPGDRRYAGVLSLGLHTPWAIGRSEAEAGLDLVAVGPQTGIDSLQDAIHCGFGKPLLGADVLAAQLGNRLIPSLSAEIARPLALGRNARLRPYLEARAGDETLLRAGVDLDLGRLEPGALWSRDTGTGWRYLTVKGPPAPGISLTLGADVAHVWDSAFLPPDGPAARDTRVRLRAGVSTRSRHLGVFYGLTWLGPEFEGQPEGQLTGALRLTLEF